MILAAEFEHLRNEIDDCIQDFEAKGTYIIPPDRNAIKKFQLSNGTIINIKSFKKPHLLNRIIYTFLRKSKAERSFQFALKLLEQQIKTPQPIGYLNQFSTWGLSKSFYISLHLPYHFTFRELSYDVDFPDHDNVLSQFTSFCFKLHNAHINFLDHSSGNTLILKEKDESYSFYLVDLNRMKFHRMNLKQRMNNLRKLTHHPIVIKKMAYKYAELHHSNPEFTHKLLQEYCDEFSKKYEIRQQWKKWFSFRWY